MIKSVRWKELFVGALLSFTLLLPWTEFFQQDPYTKVEVLSVKPVDNAVIVTANFRKNECVFQRLEVFGQDLGQTYVLQWANVVIGDGEDRGPRYDRVAGDQTLRLKVYTGGKNYDTLEIRTRHLCGDKTVDKVFAVIDLRNP